MWVNSKGLDVMISLIVLKEDLVFFKLARIANAVLFKFQIRNIFHHFLSVNSNRWSNEIRHSLLCHNQESSLKTFKHIALQCKLDISIMYTLFSWKLKIIHALVCLSKIMQDKSSKITLKSLSQSRLILKRLCLRPSTKTIFSIKGVSQL